MAEKAARPLGDPALKQIDCCLFKCCDTGFGHSVAPALMREKSVAEDDNVQPRL